MLARDAVDHHALASRESPEDGLEHIVRLLKRHTAQPLVHVDAVEGRREDTSTRAWLLTDRPTLDDEVDAARVERLEGTSARHGAAHQQLTPSVEVLRELAVGWQLVAASLWLAACGWHLAAGNLRLAAGGLRLAAEDIIRTCARSPRPRRPLPLCYARTTTLQSCCYEHMLSCCHESYPRHTTDTKAPDYTPLPRRPPTTHCCHQGPPRYRCCYKRHEGPPRTKAPFDTAAATAATKATAAPRRTAVTKANNHEGREVTDPSAANARRGRGTVRDGVHQPVLLVEVEGGVGGEPILDGEVLLELADEGRHAKRLLGNVEGTVLEARKLPRKPRPKRTPRRIARRVLSKFAGPTV